MPSGAVPGGLTALCVCFAGSHEFIQRLNVPGGLLAAVLGVLPHDPRTATVRRIVVVCRASARGKSLRSLLEVFVATEKYVPSRTPPQKGGQPSAACCASVVRPLEKGSTNQCVGAEMEPVRQRKIRLPWARGALGCRTGLHRPRKRRGVPAAVS